MSVMIFRVMAVSVFLLVFFVFGVKAEQGGVSFWRNDVTLTCPENGTWFQLSTQLHMGKTYVFKYERPINVYCVYETFDQFESEITKKTFFYVKGRVCETCYEVDGVYLGGAIFADVIMTTTLMAFIYNFAKKGSAASPSGGRASDIQSSDYQELNPRSVSQATYSAVSRRK
ncbi:T-cell surface glycoprotein CD3 epsilon chain isoform X1 [Oryzias melastigma]|nr:T-cell surface glycoprotein CD3 epsilon chain isoform X1 [Oryzias melastigma]